MPTPNVVSREEWLKARVALLAEEKDFTRRRDALAEKVRALPWVKVDKPYAFDAPTGRKSLADLFAGKSQLIVYHFMFDPTWSQGCMGCSFLADHFNGIVTHLAQRDISFVAVSKAPMEKILPFRTRMGWSFSWVSGSPSDFGRDFGVSFTDQELTSGGGTYNFTDKPGGIRELPGISVFTKGPAGDIYHTYSTFARGLEDFLTAYRYIDIAPKGRDEQAGEGMKWVRHHDRYNESNFVPPWTEIPGITAPVLK